eukprot:gnl/TRDRNA2_/TRDRNA2_83883_c0_seq1.p1 gnl/TRDRNA2_/TRDRNA2_83883_c0~~gnl/TRDRNA2_/TRDRNA2_83883_c0_seq1.p1  ORF type:complete len:322 (+),score=54.81 gnl/TRDRNA2_/TRDRNA2_83883_c0_seq1:70-1035(+)
MAAAVRCGFIGLGSMGGRMAANTAKKFGVVGGPTAAHCLLVHDLNEEAAKAVAAANPVTTSVASSQAEIASRCSSVLLCLPDGAIVRNVVRSIAPHVAPGTVVVDCSTTGPEVAQEAAAVLAETGAHFLDAPVTGTPARASSATLTVMVGGDAQHLAEVRPILETFGSRVLHMGAIGSGQVTKAMNNCLYNVSVAAMAEMLPLAQRAGISLEPFVEAVSSGTGQSFGFQQWAPKVLERDFGCGPGSSGFPMGQAFKDLETLAALADREQVALPPVVAAARSTYERALAMGLHSEHKGAMVKVWEKELDVECRNRAGARCRV